MKIRSQLVLLVVGMLVPMLVFAGGMLVLFNQHTRDATERGLVETARALSVAVDQQVGASISTLEALATSEHLRHGDLREFHKTARDVVATQRAWQNVILYGPDGRQLVNTWSPFGARLPKAANAEVIARTLRTRAPVVSDLFVGAVLRRPLILVVVPVMREGSQPHALGAVLTPTALTDVLLQQRVPPAAIGSLLDRNKVIIARTRAAERFIGQRGTVDLTAKMDETAEGAFRLFTKEGQAVYAAISRSPRTGWTIALGVPQVAADAPLRSSLWLLLLCSAALLLGGIWVAVRGARRISAPMASLATAARALVKDEPVELTRTSLTEVDEVARAMELASQERRQREAAAGALAAVGRELVGTLDPREVVSRILSAVTEVFRVRRTALYQVDGPAQYLVCVASAGDSKTEQWIGQRLAKGEATAGRALAEGRTISSADIISDPEIVLPEWAAALEQAEPDGCHAMTSVPLEVRGQILGVLSLGYEGSRIFTEREHRLLSAFGDQAAIALSNARFVGELKMRQARLEALLELSRQLSRIQPVTSLVTALAEACGHLLGTDSVGIRLVEGDELVLAGAYGDAKQMMSKPRLKIGESFTGRVAASGEPLQIMDPENDSRLTPEHRGPIRGMGYRAWLGVPVKAGERILGVLSIRTKRSDGFSTEDMALMTTLAAQAAVALENSRLYQETRRALDELSQTQAQLTQAQKMEAIGQLAGGIAHDFNNLLTVISGRSHLFLDGATDGSPGRRDVQLIAETADRAAALTHQLLAFSRKQVLQPTTLDLNAVIGELAPMLRRLIGEHIELVIVPGGMLGWVTADPGQFQQVVMNLAVNARDAMLEGGTVRIETENRDLHEGIQHGQGQIPPGRYVGLVVHDTGNGMDAVTLTRIFEPFFTTKEPGKGTGLGLATVHGIVHQSGGYVGVDSAVGRGTTFTIYLPTTAALAEARATSAGVALLPRGRETVLLVEDDQQVRELAHEVLRHCGYTVLQTGDPLEALLLEEQHRGRIQLLLSDMVMPAMRGPVLAGQLHALSPEVRILYMSGYTDDMIGPTGTIDPPGALLHKPFTPATLARAVRDALDAISPWAPVVTTPRSTAGGAAATRSSR